MMMMREKVGFMMGRFTLCFFFPDNKLELESKQMVLLVIELELELESKRP